MDSDAHLALNTNMLARPKLVFTEVIDSKPEAKGPLPDLMCIVTFIASLFSWGRKFRVGRELWMYVNCQPMHM